MTVCRCIALKPWMEQELAARGPSVFIRVEATLHDILDIFAQCAVMGRPCILAGTDTCIHATHRTWWIPVKGHLAREHPEKDAAHRPDIRLFWIVPRTTTQELRRCILFRSASRLKPRAGRVWRRKTKVCQPQVGPFCIRMRGRHQDVLELDITMTDEFGMQIPNNFLSPIVRF